MKNFKKIILIILGFIISPIINGFVFSKLWFWFIVPPFDLPILTIAQSIGIIFLINFIILKIDLDSENEYLWKLFIKKISLVIFKAVFVLICAWIVTLFL